MTTAAGPARPRWVVAAVAGLLVMIVWTLVVKYLAPALWLVAERAAGRAPAAAPVMWDLWPLAHGAVAAMLWSGHRATWTVALAVAAVEVGVVGVKLALYLGAPDLSFWRLLWLTNKVYVLGYFLALLGALLGPGRRDLRPAPAWGRG